jgi:hypothetical protein
MKALLRFFDGPVQYHFSQRDHLSSLQLQNHLKEFLRKIYIILNVNKTLTERKLKIMWETQLQGFLQGGSDKELATRNKRIFYIKKWLINFIFLAHFCKYKMRL